MNFPFFNSNNKTRIYKVLFTTTVKNLSSAENLVHIVMPLTLKNSYQKLIGKYRITPKGKLKTENKFQNRYIYWNETLKPNEEKRFELKFKTLLIRHDRPINTKEDLSKFLRSDKFISAKKVKEISDNLVKNIGDTFEKVKILNNYVVSELAYGNPIKGLYTTEDALKKDLVDCGGFDALLISLCIAQKIPARLVCGFFANENNAMHTWVEIFIESQGWIIADPSIEKLSKESRTKKRAGLGFMSCDVIALSIGQDFKIDLGDKNISLDILQNPEVFTEKGKDSIKFESEFKVGRI